MAATVDQHSECVDQAAKLKERNRGSMNEWLYTGYDDQNFESPRPKSRTNTDEAKKNSDRDRGCMSDVMAMCANPPQPDSERSSSPVNRSMPKATGAPVTRCPSDAAKANMGRHTGDGVRAVMVMPGDAVDGEQVEHVQNDHVTPSKGGRRHFGGEKTTNGEDSPADKSPNKTRTRPEGQANAAKNKGCMDLNFGSLELEDGAGRQHGRGIKADALGNFQKNQGSLTGIMGNYAKNERSPPPNRRVKPEGATNAGRAGGTGAADCLSMGPA